MISGVLSAELCIWNPSLEGWALITDTSTIPPSSERSHMLFIFVFQHYRTILSHKKKWKALFSFSFFLEYLTTVHLQSILLVESDKAEVWLSFGKVVPFQY